MSKIYSIFVKGERVDISEEQLSDIKKNTKRRGSRKFVSVIVEGKRVDISKAAFDTALRKAEPMKGSGKMVVLVTDDPEGKYQCATCNMYVPETGECTNVLGRIEPEGTCQLHVQGPTAKPNAINPFRMLKDEIGYDEREEGFGCIRCIRFKAPHECKIITDEVDWNKCCNYQFDGDIERSTRMQQKYEEEQDALAQERLKSTGGDRTKLEHKLRETKKAMGLE